MFRAMLRGLLQHKLRLLLSALAIILGTMFMSAAFVAGDTIAQGFTSLFTTINSNLDVQVTAKQPDTGNEGDQPPTAFVPQSVADQVAKVDGAAQSSPRVTSDGARIVDKNGKVVGSVGPPRLGSGWSDDDSLVVLREGSAPAEASQVALSANLAKTTGYKVGDTVDVITLEPRQSFTVSGIFGYEGDRDTLAGETNIAFTMPTAQKLMLGKTGVYTSVDVKAADGVGQTALKQRIAAVVGPDYKVQTADEAAKDQASDTQTFVNVLKTALTVFAIIGMIAGAFLIFNTFSMLVAQRTRELALYRAFGASKGQVNRAVLFESALLGLVASIVGLGIGIGVGWLLKELLENFSNAQLPVSGVVVKPYVVIVTLLVGVLFTVVSALIPALRASRVPPIAAMREAAVPDKPLRKISIIGGVLLAAGLLLLILRATKVIKGQLALTLGGGALLVFLGVVLLAPLLTGPFSRVLGPLFGGAASAKLGARNTARNPRRTAVTAAALMIGVTLATAAGVFATSAKAGITDAFTSDVRAQLIVTGGFTDLQAGFDPALESQIAAIPGVKAAAAIRADFGKVSGTTSQIWSGDPVALAELFTLKPQSGEIRQLKAGETILDSETAKRLNATVGSTVPVLTARGGEQELTVVGILQPSTILQGSPIISAADATTDFTSPKAQQAYVEVADGANVDAVKAQLDKMFADNPEVTVVSQAEQLKRTTSILDVVLTILYVLLGLTILVAVLGVINTLLLSIYERTREIGLIRAIGMNRGQTTWMITVESVLISVLGVVLGVVVGVALGVLVVKILGGDFLKLTIPWGYLVITLILAIIAGVVAAILPAIRASRLNVLEAIAYE